MALDDIVKFGKKGLIAEAFGHAYKEDNTLNPSLEIFKWQGVDRITPDVFADAQQVTPDYTPSRHQKSLDDYISENAGNAIREVQTDVSGALGLITKDEVMRDYIVQRKPVKFAGIDDELFKAHEAANKAYGVLRNEDALKQKAHEYIAERLKKLADAKVGDVVIRLVQGIYAGNPGLAVQRVQRDALAKIGEFNEKFKEIGTARSYALARYNTLSDADKVQEAYEIAKAAARSA